MRARFPQIVSCLLCLLASPAAFAADLAKPDLSGPDLSGNDPHWIEDRNIHCWAANPTPETGETIEWTGACENGLLSGKGTLTWYTNGRIMGRDQGTFENGELFGHGQLYFADGASFDGNFPGDGTLTLPDGRKVAAHSLHEMAGWSIEEVRSENP